jgi:hypothetical protein
VDELTDDVVAFISEGTRTGARYMGADRAEEYGRRNSVPGEPAVRLLPTKVLKAFGLAQ